MQKLAAVMLWFVGACASGGAMTGGDDDDDEMPDAWVDPAPDARVAGGADAAPSSTPDAALPPPGPDAAPPPPASILYAHSASDLYRLEGGTLAATHVGPFVWPAAIVLDYMTDVAVDETGGLIGISFGRVYQIDPVTGVCTHLSDLTGEFNGLSFVPAGTLDPTSEALVATAIDGSLWRLDPMTGVATQVGAYGNGMTSSGDAVSAAGVGTVATVKKQGVTGDSLAIVDATTGVATAIGDTGFTDIWGLGAADGIVYGFTATNQIVQIDAGTGVATLVSTGMVSWWGAGGR